MLFRPAQQTLGVCDCSIPQSVIRIGARSFNQSTPNDRIYEKAFGSMRFAFFIAAVFTTSLLAQSGGGGGSGSAGGGGGSGSSGSSGSSTSASGEGRSGSGGGTSSSGEGTSSSGEGTSSSGEGRETPAKEVRMGLPATRGAEALVSKLPAKAAALVAAVSEGVGVLLLARSLVSPTMTNVVTLASRKKTNSKEARRKGG